MTAYRHIDHKGYARDMDPEEVTGTQKFMDRLEPDLHPTVEGVATASMAVSFRRIADALQFLARVTKWQIEGRRTQK
jgi:hypothetical protein